MINTLIDTYYSLIEDIPTDTYRYLYKDIDINQRLIGLVGPRGTGKTTILLQCIKNKIKDLDKAIYVSADHIYFSQNTLLEFVNEQHLKENRDFFFIDEIHKYPGWNRELKNIYDSYPKIKLLFSGSSSIDLIKGSYDLSRRGIIFNLKGMSFREFLNFKLNIKLPVYNFEQILSDHRTISRELSSIPKLLGHFQEFISSGYYPFYFEDKKYYKHRVMNVIEKTIYEDISSFFNLPTKNLHILKQIIYYFTTIKPGELKVSNLSRNLQIDIKTLNSYLDMLIETGLLCKIGVKKSGGALLRKKEKYFLDNVNLYNVISSETGLEHRNGTTRELFFIKSLINADLKLFYSDIGDYSCNDIFFEIGGKDKTTKQIKDHLDTSYLVKDNILTGENSHSIPLYLFGFLY